MVSLAPDFEFAYDRFFPESIFDKITDLRVTDPGIVLKSAGRRKRRERLTVDGKLAILAADHPARRVTSLEVIQCSWVTGTATWLGFSG